jgi:NADH-quinone oxidoreductase subunit L
MESILFLIPMLPLVAFLLDFLLGRWVIGKKAHYPAWLAMGAAFILSVLAVIQVGTSGQPLQQTLWHWMPGQYLGGFDAPFTIYIDQLTSVMILIVTGVGFLIHVYSAGYMAHDPGFYRFFAYLSLFIFMMLVLVLADNYLVMFFGWEGVGLCSYLLIGFWYDRKTAADAAKKAFIVNRVGDLGFTVGMFLTFITFGTLSFYGPLGVFANVHKQGEGIMTAIALLLFVGAVGKSAQFPLHVWLPDAMEGPTPVSALIHAATMVTAGVYMSVRSQAIFLSAPAAMHVVMGIGLFTAFLAATIGLVQNDIKKVLAYSTVSQLGYMVFSVGVGAFVAAIFHLLTHAFFKALLFLGAGSVIHGMHDEQDMRKMGGLKKYMPITYYTFVIAGLALAGFPLTAGFFSKDEILVGAWHAGYWWAAAIGWLVAAMTAFYTFRMIYLTFHGEPRFDEHHVHPHESPWVMLIPLIVLAVPSAVAGLVLGIPPDGGMIHTWLDKAFVPLSEAAGVVAHEAAVPAAMTWAGFVISGLLAIGGIWLAYAMYVTGRISPKAMGARFHDFYVFFLNKWYIDEFYHEVIVAPLAWLATVLWKWIDAGFIDGIVNGVGWLFGGVSQRLRRVQTGIVSNYALAIALGTVIIVGVYLIWGPQFLGR